MESMELMNTNQPDYLKEGVYPIMSCIGTTPDQIGNNDGPSAEDFSNLGGNRKSIHINFLSKKEDLEKKGITNAGEGTYVISPIDDSNKYSYSYYDCTGVVATGIDKATGKNISFITHQNPERFLKDKSVIFFTDLEKTLNELKSRCEDHTIDVVIVGGQDSSKFGKDDYQTAITLLKQSVNNTLGFKPTVVAGPKSKVGEIFGDIVFFDTHNKRLYLFRNNSEESR